MAPPNLPFRLIRPAPDPVLAEAVLRLLETPEPASEALAELAMRDAPFTLALLSMRPLQPGEATTLKRALTERIDEAGDALLRAWLMHTGSQQLQADAVGQLNMRAGQVAETAMHLAIELRYPRPDEAYLAGLWHHVGALSLLASTRDFPVLRDQPATALERRQAERQRFGIDQIQLAAWLAESCGLPPTLRDALALAGAHEEHVAGAHPLARILRAAIHIAGPDATLDEAARLTGLDTERLSNLKTDVDYLSTEGLKSLGIGAPGAAEHERKPSGYPMLPSGWRAVALGGLLAGAFEGIDGKRLSLRLGNAFRLLFGKTPPLMLTVTEGQVQPLPMDTAQVAPHLITELGLQVDDDTSVVALALRTQASTSHFPGGDGPGRSTRDWHLARWLGTAGILCVPWQIEDTPGVAVVGLDEHLDLPTEEQQLMARLVSGAARALAAERTRRRAMDQLGETLMASQREHIRRVTHEIKSPLTVIKSYLGVIGQRHPEDPTLATELNQVSQEIDRVGRLLGQLAHPESATEEPRSTSVSGVVQELQHVYGEPLFGQRNRELEIRIPGGLPPVAIPASTLKQVLLNLVRNAAEALPEGHRLTISSPGVLITDGRHSLELELADNGPGIPEPRLHHLFEAAESSKGGEHQGLGLSIVKDLLGQFGSYIFCRTHPERGTRFNLFIPLAKPA
ncbi:HDOD domain-containing protein [Nitrogeniibacter mangrovi]|uniref:histidine kinase n=1 Tax=Nitrogeniibacter mangrovi TaxID=2016596 RepID=A0A6C1B1M0_9RHOO|nr:ATP-binding protein [Nitrogeniibacter mangrovi]QID16879.1 HDOD domain-containing protein [Nitrogeniibacter mangrovi]